MEQAFHLIVGLKTLKFLVLYCMYSMAQKSSQITNLEVHIAYVILLLQKHIITRS